MVIIGLFFAAIALIYTTNERFRNTFVPSFPISTLTSTAVSSTNRSRWSDDKLVVIPAIWKEIDWANRSSWPLWLLEGLNPQSSYRVHLYQRIDFNSTAPYDWPYCANRHEETGVYLQFIYEYYYDLPKKMLFIHGNPFAHTSYSIESAHCIRDDVHYASINTVWFGDRAWNVWARGENDTVGRMYRCASYLLGLFGLDGDSQLNPKKLLPKSNSTVTAPCCAQFFVTRNRIRHYTYEQWSAVYRAHLQPYCVTPDDAEIPGEQGLKWFGGSFEHLWHVILGLYPSNMEVPRTDTTSDICHLFRSSCKGSPCTH